MNFKIKNRKSSQRGLLVSQINKNKTILKTNKKNSIQSQFYQTRLILKFHFIIKNSQPLELGLNP